MGVRLSSDIVEQMAPLLGGLAKLIATGSLVGEAELSILLAGVSLEDMPDVLAEGVRWAGLLTSLRRQADLRPATVESLLMRGLPEATVILAVATVADASGTEGAVDGERSLTLPCQPDQAIPAPTLQPTSLATFMGQDQIKPGLD